MPYSIEYAGDGGVITTFTGEVSDQELFQTGIDRTADRDRLHQLRYVIDDHTGAVGGLITPQGTRDTVRFAFQITAINPDIVFAVVLPQDVQYGMGRLWQSHAHDSRINVRLFRDRDEADQWVREELDKLEGHTEPDVGE